jgi:thiosulfate/3-mercaptopyruvate sulfurtransferase
VDRPLPHLIDVDTLTPLRGVRIVDVRWRLGDPRAGAAAYAKGHIPGALFADVDRDLAAPPGDRGRHPLPSPEAFAETMRRLGIGDDTRVVAYDDQGGATAARLWFLLRYFGHETGSVLDGGLDAWTAAGHALETGTATPTPADFHPRVRPELLVERADMMDAVQSGGLLLDARAPERYRGEVEPIDRVPGHIPGAVNAPFQDNLESGRFRSKESLRERYTALGAERPVIAYCGSGVTACHDLLALAVAGFPAARLYPGSWSEWCHDPAAPIEVGPGR